MNEVKWIDLFQIRFVDVTNCELISGMVPNSIQMRSNIFPLHTFHIRIRTGKKTPHNRLMRLYYTFCESIVQRETHIRRAIHSHFKSHSPMNLIKQIEFVCVNLLPPPETTPCIFFFMALKINWPLFVCPKLSGK